MWIQGFSLNTLTLLALALSVGIVIDDAIVVLENIFRFVEEKGLKPAAAAILATREIGLAVLATTLSLIGVFLPVAFMGGIVGRFLNSFGLTMSFAIAVSLVVSFTLTPMLSSRWLRPVGGGPEGRHTQKTLLERLVDGFYLPIERAYERSLRWVMVHRWVVVVACVVALGSIVPLAKVVPAGFLPVADEAQFEVNVRAPEGTSLAETTLIGERVASQIRRRLDQDGLLTLTLVGGDQSKTKNRASIYVRLTDPEQRTITQHEYMDIIRKEVLATLPKNLRVDVSVVPPFQGGGSAATIQYEISGPDLQKLQTYSNAMAEAMRAVPGAVDVDTSFIAGKPEVQVRIDREKAAALGVSVADIAVTLRTLVSGAAVSSYLERGEQYDVNLRAEPEYRADADGLSLVSVPSARGGTVPLMDVVHLEEATGPSAVNHLNRRRQVLITANNAKGSSESAILGAAVRPPRTSSCRRAMRRARPRAPRRWPRPARPSCSRSCCPSCSCT
jgi:HAE1 family hydrophobic/amphiphilic exporter-1